MVLGVWFFEVVDWIGLEAGIFGSIVEEGWFGERRDIDGQFICRDAKHSKARE